MPDAGPATKELGRVAPVGSQEHDGPRFTRAVLPPHGFSVDRITQKGYHQKVKAWQNLQFEHQFECYGRAISVRVNVPMFTEFAPEFCTQRKYFSPSSSILRFERTSKRDP